MTLPSVSELVHLFDDEALAREVYAAETVSSWPSLRILAALCESETASTGQLARETNMDMLEVRNHLEALADLGVVTESDGQWSVTTERVQLNVTLTEELAVSHAVGTDESLTDDDDDRPTDDAPLGLITRLRQLFSGSG